MDIFSDKPMNSYVFVSKLKLILDMFRDDNQFLFLDLDGWMNELYTYMKNRNYNLDEGDPAPFFSPDSPK